MNPAQAMTHWQSLASAALGNPGCVSGARLPAALEVKDAG
jgi:hypothetical protein